MAKSQAGIKPVDDCEAYQQPDKEVATPAITQAGLTKHYTAQHRLTMVERLAAKWRRHEQAGPSSEFSAGMMRAYAECIRLELDRDGASGLTVSAIEEGLRSGDLGRMLA